MGARVGSVVMMGLIAILNVRGTRNSATVQNWTTGAKVGSLLVLSGVLLAFGHPAQAQEATWAASFSSALAVGMG